jgi:hypothetical protein
MTLEIWHRIIDWFADNGILISVLISLVMTIQLKFGFINIKQALWFNTLIICLTIILSMTYFLIQLSYWPFTFIPLLIIFLCYIFKNRITITKQKIISLYFISTILLIFAFELAKVSSNTWGSGTLFAGVFMIVYIIPLYQLIRQISEQEKIFGLYKLISGLILIGLIIIQGFGNSDYDGETVLLIRKNIIFLSIIFFIEGLVVLFPKQNITQLRQKRNNL